MKRDKFLKIISSGSGGLLLATGMSLSKGLNYDLREVSIYDNFLNGLSFRKKALSRIKIQLGEAAQLVREQENIYDFYAIKVMIQNEFVGYIAAYENVVLANLMDVGTELKATVSKVHFDENDEYLQKALAIKITTKQLVPINNLEQVKSWQQSDDAVDIYRQGYEIETTKNNE